jgi:hypothetical protein
MWALQFVISLFTPLTLPITFRIKSILVSWLKKPCLFSDFYIYHSNLLVLFHQPVFLHVSKTYQGVQCLPSKCEVQNPVPPKKPPKKLTKSPRTKFKKPKTKRKKETNQKQGDWSHSFCLEWTSLWSSLIYILLWFRYWIKCVLLKLSLNYLK